MPWHLMIPTMLGAIALAEPSAPPRSPELGLVQSEVVYATLGERELHMSLAWPMVRPAPKLPAILYIHGGAFRAGSHQGRTHLHTAQRGYFSASVEYRLSGEAHWPAQAHDVKAAVRWLRAHADEYGIDPERIGVWGHSAGACLSMLLGTTGDVPELEGDEGATGVSSRVQCVVSYFGLSDFVALTTQESAQDHSSVTSPEGALFGADIADVLETARFASPLTHVSADDPPFLLLHGQRDPLLPWRQSEALHEALSAAGVPSELVLLPEAGHGGDGWDDPELEERVARYWDAHLNGGAPLLPPGGAAVSAR